MDEQHDDFMIHFLVCGLCVVYVGRRLLVVGGDSISWSGS